MGMLASYQPLLDLFLLNLGFAFSQQIVLRAGVFSVATAGFGAIGGYCVAILVRNHGFSPFPPLIAALALGALAGAILSVPLARLRGVYQAIATLAFVEIVIAVAYYAEDLTGGAMGINSIPKSVTTWHLLFAAAVVLYIMHAIGGSRIGRAFDAIRQNEVVGASLGVPIVRFHMLAFIISGALAGLYGGLQSLYVYSVEPESFGFGMMTAVLTFIVLGGRGTVLGPVVGTAVLTLLPEIARPLAENRQLIHGVLLVVIMNFLPNGLVDSLALTLRQHRSARRDRTARSTADAITGS